MDFKVVLRRFGQNLRKARWLRGLTQQDAATSTGINYRYYQELERGIRNPSLRMVFDLAQAFGVRVTDLLDVGERTKSIRLSEVEASPPPRGRKPKPKGRAAKPRKE